MMDRFREPEQELSDDVVIVERNEASRSIVGMCGRLAIDTWRDADGKSRQFPCQIQKISPHGIALTAPVSGSVGDWVVAYFGPLGSFQGPIIRTPRRSLVMRIVATNEDRARLARTIEWLSSGKPDARRFPRTKPQNPESTLSLAPGQTMPCVVIDHSICGAAVFVAATPAIGAIVKIGRIVGRVVRHFAGGFAVTFPTLQDPNLIEKLILSPA